MSRKVLLSLEENINLPFSVLALLTTDKVAWAINQTTPADVLKDLAQEDRRSIRFHVARNPNTGSDVLVRLTSDTCTFVARAARRTMRVRYENDARAPDAKPAPAV
jgi:hypothetical protein